MTEDWYKERAVVAKELAERLKSDSDFARRFNEGSFSIRDADGRDHRLAVLNRVDPDLAASITQRLPIVMDLRFHPKWLAHALGEILFISDQSIKELWYGASAWGAGRSALPRFPTASPRISGPAPHTAEEWEQATGLKIASESRNLMEQSFGAALPVPVRWWFTPGGKVKAGDRVLDLSQVQPILQTQRMAPPDKATLELQTPIPGVTVKQEIILNPLGPAPEDPWDKAAVEDVNKRFDAYAEAIPEWQALARFSAHTSLPSGSRSTTRPRPAGC